MVTLCLSWNMSQFVLSRLFDRRSLWLQHVGGPRELLPPARWHHPLYNRGPLEESHEWLNREKKTSLRMNGSNPPDHSIFHLMNSFNFLFFHRRNKFRQIGFLSIPLLGQFLLFYDLILYNSTVLEILDKKSFKMKTFRAGVRPQNRRFRR